MLKLTAMVMETAGFEDALLIDHPLCKCLLVHLMHVASRLYHS